MVQPTLLTRFAVPMLCGALGAAAGCGDDASPSTPGAADTGSDAAAVGDAGLDTDAGGNADAGSSSDTAPGDSPRIVGAYDTNFGGFLRITATGADFSWYGSGDVLWSTWSNDERYLVGQNASTDPFNPDRFSRFDWVEAGGSLYVCQSAFDAVDEAAALATPRADDTDPATTGCGGAFSWTMLTPGQGPLPVLGTWSDPFGQVHEVGADAWVTDGAFTYEVLRFDNEAEYLVARNGAGTGDAEGAYSRFDWAFDDGAFSYCQIAFDAESEAAAEGADTADRQALSTDGCNGFPWSELTAVEAE
jgi:hypothetical protein